MAAVDFKPTAMNYSTWSLQPSLRGSFCSISCPQSITRAHNASPMHFYTGKRCRADDLLQDHLVLPSHTYSKRSLKKSIQTRATVSGFECKCIMSLFHIYC